MIKQTVLPFKLEKTNDLITSHAGPALLGEFAVGTGLNQALDRYLPGPGRGAGYLASELVFPIVLMLTGGHEEDQRRFRFAGDFAVEAPACAGTADRDALYTKPIADLGYPD